VNNTDREDVASGNVWPPAEIGPSLDNIASELGRIGDYLEALVYRRLSAHDDDRDAWQAAQQAALRREASGEL